MDKLENTRSRVQCIRSMCLSFWPLILKQTVILTAMSNYFLSFTQIIGPCSTPNGNPVLVMGTDCIDSCKSNYQLRSWPQQPFMLMGFHYFTTEFSKLLTKGLGLFQK